MLRREISVKITVLGLRPDRFGLRKRLKLRISNSGSGSADG
jgi:hypothetical protein